jgi:hypothetical protein
MEAASVLIGMGAEACLFASSDSREVWDSRKDEGQDIIVLALGYC